MSALDRLLEIAGDALTAAPATLPERPAYVDPRLWAELESLLERRNGFFAFESALHAFAAGGAEPTQDGWNRPDGWKAGWDGIWDDCWCFAQDAFGSQFALTAGGVVLAEAETGEHEPVGATLAEWAERILADYEYLTGHPLARAWQEQHGALPAGKRLFPKTPFTMGGAYSVENLGAVDAAQAMRARGHIYLQVRDLPPGSRVRLRIVD